MTVFATFGWCLISFWIGVATTRWGKAWVHPTWAEMAKEIIRSVRKCDQNRKLVGEGPSISVSRIYGTEELGRFKITVERASPEEAA